MLPDQFKTDLKMVDSKVAPRTSIGRAAIGEVAKPYKKSRKIRFTAVRGSELTLNTAEGCNLPRSVLAEEINSRNTGVSCDSAPSRIGCCRAKPSANFWMMSSIG